MRYLGSHSHLAAGQRVLERVVQQLASSSTTRIVSLGMRLFLIPIAKISAATLFPALPDRFVDQSRRGRRDVE